MTVLSIAIFQTSLSIISIGFHLIGIWMLRQPNSFQTNQKIYLIQISISEISFLTLQNVILYMKLLRAYELYFDYLSLLLCGVAIAWIYIMTSMTVDRYLQVFLNIKYDLHVTKQFTKLLIMAAWTVAFVLFVALSFLNYFGQMKALVTTLKFILPAHHAMIIIVFVYTYAYIYYKIRRCNQHHPGISTKKRNSLIPLLLVLTLVIFVLVPGVIHRILVSTYSTKIPKEYVLLLVAILISLGSLVDALIYIIINESIRRRFLRLLRRVKEGLRTNHVVFDAKEIRTITEATERRILYESHGF